MDDIILYDLASENPWEAGGSMVVGYPNPRVIVLMNGWMPGATLRCFRVEESSSGSNARVAAQLS